MSDTTGSPTQPGTAAQSQTDPQPASPAPHFGQPNRLMQVLAWVGIVAGLMFIVSLIFLIGLVIGRGAGGDADWYRGHRSTQVAPESSMNHCPARNSGGMMGPGGMHGMMEPEQGSPEKASPSSPAPSAPPGP